MRLLLLCALLPLLAQADDTDAMGQSLLDGLSMWTETFGFLTSKDQAEASGAASAPFHEEEAVLAELFSATGPNAYNRDKAPPGNDGRPLEVDAKFVIDHIEPLDEDEETMSVHGSVTLEWEGDFMWKYEQHKKVKLISRPLTGFKPNARPWLPKIFFERVEPSTSRRSQATDALATTVTLWNTGLVTMRKKFSLKVPCDFNYRDFPFDTQQCSIQMSSFHTLREMIFIYSESERHPVRQLKRGNSTPTIGNFVLDSVDIFSTVADSKKTAPKVINLNKLLSELQSTGKIQPDAEKVVSLFLELTFDRVEAKVLFGFSLPLVVCALLAQCAMFFDTKKGYLVMGIAFFLLLSQISLISENFPSDSDGTPLLVVMHYLALLHMSLCFVGLLLLAAFFAPREGLTKERPATPETYLLGETKARALFFAVSALLLAAILVGTLVIGSWHHWEKRKSFLL